MQLTRKNGLFSSSRILFLPAEEIVPNPAQPRQEFEPEALRELSDSISRYGVLQPLTVRLRGRQYELVAGERRLRAARMAGLEQVPCILLEVDGDEAALIALVENLHRRDLDFIEEAEGLSRLIQIHGMSQEEAARRVGKSQSAVANKLRLLRLSPEILAVIRKTGLTERHARALLRLPGEQDRRAVLTQVLRRGLSVSKTESYVTYYLSQKKEMPAPKPAAKPLVMIKDVRFFLNTVNHGLDVMRASGVPAQCGRDETETDIILTIKIPKAKAQGA